MQVFLVMSLMNTLINLRVMRKVKYIILQMLLLIRKHKLSFLAPLLLILAFLAILVYYIGPAVIVSFIYAGV